MPRAYTACRSGCALLPSVHVELKKRKIIKKRGSRESFDETIIKKYDFIEESPSCLFLMAFLCFLNILFYIWNTFLSALYKGFWENYPILR